MTFSRIRPLGWGFGNKLSSAEENQMDINLSKAVDKTGDTITGTETLASGSKIVMKSGSEFKAEFGATTNFYGYTYLKSGARLSFDPGGLIEGTPTLNGILTVDGMGHSIATSAGGRFVLGDNDWVEFSTSRSYSKIINLMTLGPVGSLGTWVPEVSVFAAYSGFKSTTTGSTFVAELPPLHLGATLDSVDLWFLAKNGHVALPANQPKFYAVRRTKFVQYNPISFAQDLSSGGPVMNAAPNVGSYNNVLQRIRYVCNQNNVVSDPNYVYCISVFDEDGANALAGNIYLAVGLNYTNIPDTRFP